MKFHYKFVVLLLGLLAVHACISCDAKEPGHTYLTHASRRILVDDESRSQIEERWGKPGQKMTKDFRALKYGRPVKVPAFDEQWVYAMPESIGHRIVYFKGGVVSLCVEEWSDW